MTPVSDNENLQAYFDGELGAEERAAFEAGLICYPMAGTIDGRTGDHVLLAPPFIIGDGEIDELVDKLDRAISVALRPS